MGKANNKLVDLGRETDEDEPHVPTVSTPSVTLSRRNSQKTPSSARARIIDHTTPARNSLKGPVKGKIKFNPNKAIAYRVQGAKVLIFKTPKGSKLKWIDVRTFANDSPQSSAPSSPTMIDLEAALREGNQRTGAAITDAIYGQMFRQYHCTQFEAAAHAQPSAHAEFARVPALQGSVPRGGFSTADFSLFSSDALLEFTGGVHADLGIHDLIDFDGNVDSEELPSDMPTPSDGLTQYSDAMTSDAVMEDNDPTPTKAGQPQISDLPSSPLKRRAQPRSVSPTIVKKRRNGPGV